MGIYIHLNIMPYKINPFRWAEVYEEALSLLKAHPSELMGIRYKNFKCGRRTYYSRELEHNKDNLSERKWRVEGDMESKKSGETFQMYYDLNIYRKRAAKEKINRNEILYNIVKENRTYTSVFSDKTQGEPYHQPMLCGEIVRLMNDDNEMLRAEEMILNKRIEEWDCWDYLKKIFSRKYIPEK